METSYISQVSFPKGTIICGPTVHQSEPEWPSTPWPHSLRPHMPNEKANGYELLQHCLRPVTLNLMLYDLFPCTHQSVLALRPMHSRGHESSH